MDASDLKAFATYSLDQESRNQAPNGTDTSFISKFGVGAKEAGFYLGNRLRLVTRKVQPCGSPEDNGKVFDFSMDEEEYRKRQHSGLPVFSGKILKRDIKDFAIELGCEDAIIQQQLELFADDSGAPHFTIALIRLREDMSRKVEAAKIHIPSELAEIYRFQLLPEFLPNSFISRFQEKRKLLGVDLPLPRQIAPSAPLASAARPLSISLRVYSAQLDERPLTVDIGELPVLAAEMDSASHAFRFNMYFPDPSPRLGHKDLQKKGDFHSASDSLQPKHTMEGLILYFPFREGKETRPTLHRRAAGDDECENEEREELEQEPTFHVYWQSTILLAHNA